MKLIVGLGNPGEKYSKTRHNVGFIVVDELATSLKQFWVFEKRFNAFISKNADFILAKPSTYMNNSGDSVSSIASYYKIEPSDIFVIHDDVDLPSEEVRVKKGSGAAGHHGVESIIEKLGTKEFYRVRIGVGRPIDEKFDVEDYVLQNLSEKEYSDITSRLYIGVIVKNYFPFIQYNQ